MAVPYVGPYSVQYYNQLAAQQQAQQPVVAAQPVQTQQQYVAPVNNPNEKPGWADYWDADKGQWHYSVNEHLSSLGYASGGGGAAAVAAANPYPADWTGWQVPGGGGGGGGGVANPYPNPGTGYVPWSNLDDAGVQRNLAYWNSALPWQQFAQNNYQYGNDFVESKRRFDEQFAETQQNNLFNQKATSYGVAGRSYLPNARGWVYNG